MKKQKNLSTNNASSPTVHKSGIPTETAQAIGIFLFNCCVGFKLFSTLLLKINTNSMARLSLLP
jgi:hypothetical protein